MEKYWNFKATMTLKRLNIVNDKATMTHKKDDN